MPLEHILRALQAQADAEIEQINRAADDEAAQLIAEAEAAAIAIRARHRARVEPMLVAEAASLQNKARLGALRAVANAREELIVAAFAQAAERLAQIRESRQYPAIWRALAREAVAAVGGAAPPHAPRLIVRVDPRDVEIARAALAEMGVLAEIEMQTIPLGGLEVTTRDERIVIVNTLAARLERARSILRGPVARILTEPAASEKEWTTSTATPTPV
jgi:vacuolar-type H+-ATPase subunit E/Vma4